VRATLIVNPFASNVTNELVAEVERTLEPVETLFTERRGHATELARQACGDTIVVLSGDGVFNEVLNGADGDRPLGFLPGGGTSVLPRALGLPRTAVAAARALEHAAPRRISLGRVNGRRFGFSAGVGFVAEAVRRVDEHGRRHDGRRPGDLFFAWTVARVVLERGLRLEPAMELVGLGRAAALFVSNCSTYTYAGAFPLRMSPQATFVGGIDVAAPPRVGPASIWRYLARLAVGRGLGGLSGHDLDRLEVRCDEPLPLQADGEDLGDVGLALFECEHDAVTVLAGTTSWL